MRTLTIENNHGFIICKDGQARGSRLEFEAPGLQVWIKGRFSDIEYDTSHNLAVQVCCEMRIPVIALRRVSGKNVKKKMSDTKTRSMFS